LRERSFNERAAQLALLPHLYPFPVGGSGMIMSTARLFFSRGGLLVALPFVFVAGCKQPPPPPAPPPIVEVTAVLQRDEPISAEWIGSLDGLVNAQVRAQVTGYLMRQNYAEGTRVKAGDLLFEIDPRSFQAAYNQAKAAADKAILDLKRNNDLIGKQVVSRQDYDNAVTAQSAAQAALEQAALNLEFTKIKSPVDGVAGLALSQVGDLVGPSSGVLTTVSTIDPIKAYFTISERAYLELSRPAGPTKFPEGLDLELILSDGSVYPPHGKVYAVDRQIDPTTGTLRVAGTFPNPDNLLRPGQYARVRAVIRVAKNALEIPQRAVAELQGAYQVVTVDADNKAHVRTVKVGPRVGSRWIIEDGLKPGENVIVEGAQKVKEGTVVALKPAAATTVDAKSAGEK
jgi:membrane fusion protein (multidrug efflux system)